MANTIEKKFEKLHEFNIDCSQIISCYEGFQKLGDGKYRLLIFPKEKGSEFDAYFQGAEKIKGNEQNVYLQIEFLEGPFKGEKVVEYNFPLKGKISLNDFDKKKQKEFFFDQ